MFLVFRLTIWSVSLSNKLDNELGRRKPGKRPHRQVVGTMIMNSKLFLEVGQGEERVDRIEAFLVFPVAALYLAIMSGCIRSN